jgi:hypothetical protein
MFFGILFEDGTYDHHSLLQIRGMDDGHRRGGNERQDACIELVVAHVLLPHFGCHTQFESSPHVYLTFVLYCWGDCRSLLSASDVTTRYHAGLYEVQKYIHSALTKPISRIRFMGHSIVLLKQDLPPRLTLSLTWAPFAEIHSLLFPDVLSRQHP